MEPQKTLSVDLTPDTQTTATEPLPGILGSAAAQAALSETSTSTTEAPGVVVTDSNPAVFQPPAGQEQTAPTAPNPSVVAGTVETPPKKSLIPVDFSSFNPRLLFLAGAIFFLLLVGAGVMAYFGLG